MCHTLNTSRKVKNKYTFQSAQIDWCEFRLNVFDPRSVRLSFTLCQRQQALSWSAEMQGATGASHSTEKR